MHHWTTRRVLAAAAMAAGIAGATVIGAAPAAAGPAISCAGPRCTNVGDTIGLGYGTFTCPNGISYPSVAIVWPHSTSYVYPANCTPTVFPGQSR